MLSLGGNSSFLNCKLGKCVLDCTIATHTFGQLLEKKISEVIRYNLHEEKKL